MRMNFLLGVAFVFITVFFVGCQSDDHVTPCQTDEDCPDGQVCSDEVCAVRLGATGDVSGDFTANDGNTNEDGVHADVSEDIAEADTPPDLVVAEDAVDTAPIQDTEEDSSIPCQSRPEQCDGADNNCNDRIDEDGACDGLDIGIRVELRWDAEAADLDLHFLNRHGEFGSQAQRDENDCYWDNSNPEWGDDHSDSDNPSFSGDIHHGSSEPEVTTLYWPGDDSFRVLVNYCCTDRPADTPVNAEVDIFFDGVLVESLAVGPAQFPDNEFFWNVACLNYAEGTVVALNEIVAHPYLPSQTVCTTDCDSHCDCNQGHACISSECASENTGVYCCENNGCPLAEECQYAEGSSGLCGGAIDFDHTIEGLNLDAQVNVENLFADAGVLFSTSRADATVRTSPYELASDSRQNSCATLDDDSVDDWFLGDITATFVLKNGDEYEQAATNWVSLFVGITWPSGIFVDFFSADDPPVLLHTAEMYRTYTNYVSWGSDTPIGSVNVRMGTDQDFTIDDLSFGPLFHP